MTMYVSSRIKNSSADIRTTADDGFGSVNYPNWARWVDVGSAGVTSDGAFSPASGGEYNDKPHAVLDLSAALSYMLGRQIRQNSTFRISYLGVAMENDDAGDDNDESMSAVGRFRYYSPQKHRVKAYQTYRKAWRRFYAGGDSTSNMLFSNDGTQGEYKALRVGICDDSTEQVPFQSVDPFADVGGTFGNLKHIFNAYDIGTGGDDTVHTNRLWMDGRTGHPEGIVWSATHKNGGQAAAHVDSFEMNGLKIKAMCGLLHFVVDSTMSDDSFSFDDEYHVRVTVGIDGWGGEF